MRFKKEMDKDCFGQSSLIGWNGGQTRFYLVPRFADSNQFALVFRREDGRLYELGWAEPYEQAVEVGRRANRWQTVKRVSDPDVPTG